MNIEQVKEFAKQQGYDDVLPIGKWKDFDAYEPVFDGEDASFIGVPLMVLVKGNSIRMSTVEEAFEQLDG
jgi:hypothetical protein